MLNALKDQLVRIIDDIECGNSNISEEDEEDIIRMLRQYTRKDVPMSKYQAYTYLNMSRATFDNYIREGKLPEGKKIAGFKELIWYKRDLIKYIKKNKQNEKN